MLASFTDAAPDVPSGWQLRELGDVIDAAGDGGTPSRSNPANFGGTVAWAVISDISPHIAVTAETLTDRGLAACNAKLWPRGAVIVSTGATIGQVGVADVPLATKQGITGLVCSPEIVPEFLAAVLKLYRPLLERFAQGSTFREIRPSTLLRFRLGLPPLPEQRRIAEVLDTLDTTVLKTEQVIAKLRQVQQGLLYGLLTRGIDKHGELRDPVRHPEQFEESALGRIPRNWSVVQVHEVGEIITGRTPPSADRNAWGEGLPFVTPAEVRDEGGLLGTERSVSASGMQYVESLPAGAVLVVCIGSTLGKVGLAPWACATNQQINAVVCKEGQDPFFVCAAIRHHVGQLHRVAGLQAVPIVNKSQFGRMLLPCAPSEEQRRIAAMLRGMEARLETERAVLQKYQTLRQGLMEDLLTGRVRVTSLVDGAAA
jgi:type I restriction enzyme, S subunit